MAVPLAAFAAQPEYFPLRVGNQWSYRATSRTGTPFTMEVTGTASMGGQSYHVVTGLPSGTAYLRYSDNGTLYVWNQKQNAEVVWVQFGASDGTSFETGADACVKSAGIESHAAQATVPIGQFDNAVKVVYTGGSCADAGLTSEFYLPYVGLLQRTETSIAGPVVYDLVYARLNHGLTIITAPEQSLSVALDSSTYAAGAAATARITIRNTQTAPLTLTFPTGQRYDVVVKNEAGETVYRWSDGKAFTMAFGTMEVAGERTWMVPFTVPGQAGNYTAEVSLATQPAAYQGQVGFTVK